MSSIRLFILSSFAEHGPMHGHRLRLEAERNHVPLWTDITVGAVYGAMKRLASEGLLRETGQEREGARPTRQMFEITEQGLRILAELRQQGLRAVWFKYDPFDLALTKVDSVGLDGLPAILTDRRASVARMLERTREVNERARPNVGLAKQWALRHSERRLEAEVSYLDELIASIGDVVAAERAERKSKE